MVRTEVFLPPKTELFFFSVRAISLSFSVKRPTDLTDISYHVTSAASSRLWPSREISDIWVQAIA